MDNSGINHFYKRSDLSVNLLRKSYAEYNAADEF